MSTHNPFVDPVSDAEDHAEATLTVGKAASMTLGTDSLIVLGERSSQIIIQTEILIVSFKMSLSTRRVLAAVS